MSKVGLKSNRWRLGRTPLMCAVLAVVACANSVLAQQPVASEIETRIYALSHSDASTARTQLLGALKNVGLTANIIADRQSSRLIVAAPAATHQLVDQLLGALESPAAAAPVSSAPKAHTYRVPPAQHATLSQLGKRFATSPGFRQIYDANSNQWIVVATESVHRQIAAELEKKQPVVPTQLTMLPLPQVESPSKPANNVRPAEMSTVSLRLQPSTAATLHARLEKITKQSLPLETDDTKQWNRFALDAGDGTPLVIIANIHTGEVQLKGRDKNIRAWQRIVEALDSPSTENHATQLVSTDPHSAAEVRKTVALMASRAATRLNAPRVAMVNQDSNENTQQLQQEDQENPEGSLLGPVQIESVEGTDILLLRGNPRDVQRVLKIIDDIERLSTISEPRVEIIELEHVESQALATMLQTVFDASLSAKYGYGSVVVIPLVKPNAILLIASPTTAEKAIEILHKLDQPGKALTQFKIYRLKHTNAAKAQSVVEDFFRREETSDIPTLGPQALIVADARTNALLIRAAPRDMKDVLKLIEQIDRPGSETVNELRIFKLKNTIATDLNTVLNSALKRGDDANDTGAPNLTSLLQLVTIDQAGQQQLKSGVLADARITADAGTNSLIVTAPADSMPLMEALVHGLDQTPSTAAELKVFTILHGDAVSLADMLRDLFGSSQQGQQGGRGNNENNQRLFDMRISVDERTNSILVTATQDELLTVEAILLSLDGGDVSERQNRIYKLDNAYAEELAVSLREALSAEGDILETAPGTISPFQQLEREVVIVPDINSNSLIISASPRYYKEVERLVKELDVQAPMVMIQVLIAEVRLGDADEFGIELGLQDSVLFDRSLLQDIDRSSTIVTSGGGATQIETQIIDSARVNPGFDFGNPLNDLGNSGSDLALARAGTVAAQGLSSFALNRTSDLGFGGLVLSASSNSVSMLLRALQQSSRLEILSRPQIMAIDNQTGHIFVGQKVPYIVNSTVNTLGQRDNSIDIKDVGLDLLVTPRISPDGLVVMKVTAIKSDLGPVDEGVPISIAPNGDAINAPIINSTEAETTISALSGQTVVLSGLITKEDRELHRRVPLLADIPLLGDLFRYDSKLTQRTELLIILTPHVVSNRFESEMIKQVESARMSWCLSDVVEMHGPAGLRSQDDRMGAAEAEAVYPDMIPKEGELMPSAGTYIPTPTEMAPPATDVSDAAPEKKDRFSFHRLLGMKNSEATVTK